MKLHLAFCLFITQLVSSGSAQVQRTIAPAQDVEARRAAHHVAQLRRQARNAAAAQATSLSDRRAAIVVLSTPPVVEHVVATSPRKVDARGVLVADPSTVRARAFS